MDRAARKRVVEIATLALVVVGLSSYAAFAVVNHYDWTNPYRDGTTHTAELTFDNPSGDSATTCIEFWGASLGSYSWSPVTTPPWGETSVAGTLHIIDSQRVAGGSPGNPIPAATFTARGHTIDLAGGKRPRFSNLECSITSP